MHVFLAWQQWQGLCHGVWIFFTLTAMVWLKLSPQFLRLPLASLLRAVFSLMAVRPICFNRMVDTVPHGLGSVNSFLHT